MVLLLRARLAIAAALGVLLGAGCTTASTGPALLQTSGVRHSWSIPDTLRIGTGFIPRTLNPLLATENIESSIDRLFTDFLVTVDTRGAFVPDLATEVPSTSNGGISADGLTIRYKLRPHVTWQDGKPFSSADNKFSFDAVMNPNTDVVSRHGYDVVKSVETPSPLAVVFRLKHRVAPFLSTVFSDDGVYGVLPAHLLARYKSLDDVPYNSLPIGTGPFRVIRWLRGNRIELVRNDAYFLGKPKLKSIVIKLMPDENTEVTQLQTHEIDWFFEASVNAYKSLRRMSPAGTRIVLVPINGFQSLIYNNAKGPTRDIRIRRAITYALDKSALVRTLTFGAAAVATQDLPSFSWAYDDAQRPTRYDLAESRRLLAQAGYGPKHRLSLELYFDQSSVLNKALSVQIQADLVPLGIDVHPHAQLSSIMYGGYGANGTLARGLYELALFPLTGGIDPDDSDLLACTSIPPNGDNDSYFCNAAMDEAQKVALETYDRPRRKAAYARIQRALETNVPIDFLWWPKHIEALNPDLHGFDPNPVTETWNAWQWSI